MKTLSTKVLVSNFHFLEGPRWREGALWVSDLVGGTVYRVSLEGDVVSIASVPERPSGLGFLPDGTPLVVSMRNRQILKLDGQEPSTHADLSELSPHELNDMVVDKFGRAYVGSFGFKPSTSWHYDGAVFLITANGEARKILDSLAFPNGMVISPSNDRLVLAETFAHKLTEYEIEPDGNLVNPSLFADLGDIGPDGICMDAQGAIWVSAASKPEFVRVERGGEISHRVTVPGRQGVATALGGDNQEILFCLTADQYFEDVPNPMKTARVETVFL